MPCTKSSCHVSNGNADSKPACVSGCGLTWYQPYNVQLAAINDCQPTTRSINRHGTAAATSQTYNPMISNGHGPTRIKSTSRHAATSIVRGATSHTAACPLAGATAPPSTPIAASATIDTVTPTKLE